MKDTKKNRQEESNTPLSDEEINKALTEENEKIISENETLTAENEKLKNTLSEENDKYLRLAAEYDNFRKRSAKEREGIYADAYADALKEILPIIDNLERANASSGEEQIAEGLKMIMSQANDSLQKLGVEAFGVPGEQFDPQIHEAVMHTEDPEKGENEICEVYLKGYKKGDRIIRHCMVTVVN